MWLLTIHRWFRPSPVLQLIAISGIACGQQICFPCWKLRKQRLPVLFSLVKILRWDPSYQSFQVLWWAPGLTSTQRKLHPRLGVWLSIVIAVATGDSHSVCHNTSPGIALPTPSRSIDPLCASSGFLCIDPSGIWVHHWNAQCQQ